MTISKSKELLNVEQLKNKGRFREALQLIISLGKEFNITRRNW